MRAQTVDVKSSTGRILCCTVFRPGGKKLLAKGHVISDEDIRVLESEGMETIWVTELEDGEIGEDDAVCAVASEMGCGSFEIRLAAGGRANLLATENCCVLVDDELINPIGSARMTRSARLPARWAVEVSKSAWQPAAGPTSWPPKTAACWWMMSCSSRSTARPADRKSTRLNSSHLGISYA